MSSYAEYRCDECAAGGSGKLDWLRGSMPKDWLSFDRKDFCSYGCVAAYAKAQHSRRQFRIGSDAVHVSPSDPVRAS